MSEPLISNKILMHPPKIRNKTPAPIQTSCEQLLLEAQIHQNKEVKPPQQRIVDQEELDSYKLTKRKDFEDNLRKQRFHMGTWIKYAQWEENLQEYKRARSIFERALDIDYKNHSIWLKYAEMEMKHKFINHARNVWERAVTYLPRVDQFWYKYSYMEELLGNYKKAREIFERWMAWKPEEKAWLAYIKFEERMGEFQNCREIMYRYLEAYPRLQTYLKVAKFELKNHNPVSARQIFEQIPTDLGDEAYREDYFLTFARFEIRNKEYDRARAIFKFGLEKIPKERAGGLYEEYLVFEKQWGAKEEIDGLIISKRRNKYKSLLAENQFNYDAWFDLINLEQSAGNFELVKETFEASILNIPPAEEKRYWRRFIYLFYNYAVWEEERGRPEDARKVLEKAISLVPHSKFTFSKLWIFLANLHVRQNNLDQARKTYGIAIGKCPKEKTFLSYISLEFQLSNIDRCRQIYEKFVSSFPDLPLSWTSYANMEKNLEEYDRFRAIFELAVAQPSLNMPEMLWKSYIDAEITLKEYDRVRNLFERLLEKSKHLKVWISYAEFEGSLEKEETSSSSGREISHNRARDILTRAESYFKQTPDLKEERLMLIENWIEIEKNWGDQEQIEKIKKKLPKKIKKQKKIIMREGEEGGDEEAGWEEYYDYIFPEDAGQTRNIGILKKAQEWKEKFSKKGGE